MILASGAGGREDIVDVTREVPAWLRVPMRVIRRSLQGQITVNAAGIALFALLAAVPTLAAVVSLYGLIADPSQIEGHLDGLYTVFPRQVVDFMIVQLERATRGSSSELSATLITSLFVAVYSARNAIQAVIAGLNNSYGLNEERSGLRRLVTSIVVAIASLIAVLLVITVVVVFPVTIQLLGVVAPADWLLILRWPLILVALTGLLIALYKLAPSGGYRTERRLVPGAIVGTLLWLLASFGLSIWVDQVADYEILYGAFAGAIVVLLWFYLSALAVLIGASVNAELGPSGHRHRWPSSVGNKDA
jgi:membrane protein